MSADARVRLFHGATIVALLAALAGLTLFVGCGRGVATKPIADTPAGPGGSAVVAGTVSANGSGVADAIVTLEPIVNGRTATVSRLLRAGAEARTSGTTRGPLPAASELRVAATDAKGRYAFAGVPAGSYVLTAKGTNYLGGSKTTTVSNAAAVETTFVNLALTPTGTFSGSFWLETMTNHSGIVAYIAGTSNVAVTNAAGDFVMRDVPVGAHIVTGSRPGFLDASLSATIAAAGDSVNPGGTTLYRDRNIAPTATAFTGGNCTTGITFVGTGNDADGSIAIYEWDFDDDGEIDYYSTTTGVTVEALDPGNYQARFTVTDNKGAIASAVVQVFVSPIDTVYVSAATGSPGNPGTRALPVRSIADAISIAQSADCEPVILAATGTYVESPAFVSGIRYYGGFDEATWTKTPGARSIFNVGITPATVEPYAFGVTVNGFEFRAEMPSTPGASSIAFRAVQVGSGVQFLDCVFQASRGTPGAPGANGANGGAGTPGGAGGAGNVDCLLSCSVSGGYGGWGGQGGSGATGPATYGAYGGNGATTGSGSPGNVIACVSGGSGGAAGAACPTVGSLGTSGGAATGSGCAGSNGLNGGATPPGGYPSGIDGSVWAPNQGLTGAPGTAGGGGAGGGGGGSGTFVYLSTCYPGPGGAGGGGGGGGGAAWPGEGGGGGGSSFAVYLYDSSPGFTDCQFIAALGGDGGAGGDGGSGGAGGVGGFGGLGAGNGAGGGQGGTGGAGGHAGGGSGGAGGLSYGLLRWGMSSPLITNPSYIPGSGGSGGAGGRRGGPTGLFAPAGPAGSAGTIWP